MDRATLVPLDYEFKTAEEWLENHFRLVELGEPPIEPSNREEFLIAERAGVLKPHWIPQAEARRFFGLPPDFGQKPVPMDRRSKRQLLHTLKTDKQFLAAFCRTILDCLGTMLKEKLRG